MKKDTYLIMSAIDILIALHCENEFCVIGMALIAIISFGIYTYLTFKE